MRDLQCRTICQFACRLGRPGPSTPSPHSLAQTPRARAGIAKARSVRNTALLLGVAVLPFIRLAAGAEPAAISPTNASQTLATIYAEEAESTTRLVMQGEAYYGLDPNKQHPFE